MSDHQPQEPTSIPPSCVLEESWVSLSRRYVADRLRTKSSVTVFTPFFDPSGDQHCIYIVKHSSWHLHISDDGMTIANVKMRGVDWSSASLADQCPSMYQRVKPYVSRDDEIRAIVPVGRVVNGVHAVAQAMIEVATIGALLQAQAQRKGGTL